MSQIRNAESLSQKITAILVGAGLTAYAVVFAVQGVGSYLA